MNTQSLHKATVKLETAIRKASRILLEFEVKQSDWEYKRGIFKTYSSGKALVRAAMRK